MPGRVSIALCGLPLAAALGSAQEVSPVVIADQLSCATCTISIQKLVTLGDADGAGSLSSHPFAVRADTKGRFWILAEGELPRVYGPDGRFLQSVGRKGRGPGEFSWPHYAIPLPGDSVLVLDGDETRATVVGPDLRPGRTILTERNLRNTVVITWPTVVIMNGDYGPLGKGWGLHRVSFAGRVAELDGSFGPERVTPSQFSYPLVMQQLTTPRTAEFWAADVSRYRLTQWTAQGRKLQTIERNPSWFAGRSENALGRPTQPPPPSVTAIEEDGRSRIWVFIQLAAPTWKDGWPVMAPGTHEIPARQIAYEKLFRTMIEVIDPVSARVVARRSIDEFVMAALSNDRAAIYTVDTDGIPHISVVALALTGLPR